MEQLERRSAGLEAELADVEAGLQVANLRKQKREELEDRRAQLLDERSGLAASLATARASVDVAEQSAADALSQSVAITDALDRSYEIDWAAEIRDAVTPTGLTTGKEH